MDRVDLLLDDCNLGFIDIVALKRFMKKCGVLASNELLLSIIRRFDIDQDTRLSQAEFLEGIIPIERFTKGTLQDSKRKLSKAKLKVRP